MNKAMLEKSRQDAINTFSQIDYDKVHSFGMLLQDAVKKGAKILVCGNGGSGSQADHFEAELVGRYLSERKPLPCISLCQSASSTSCIVNDYGGQYIFSRPLQAHARKGDILVALTTSGNSPNILEALKVAKELGVTSIALLGKDGGKAKSQADHAYVVSSNSTARIQEAHIHIIHCMCEYLE